MENNNNPPTLMTIARHASVLVLIALLLVSMAAGSLAATPQHAADSPGGAIQAKSPPTDGGTIGVEKGYDHDAPLFLDRSDGLNNTELEALTYRTMARVEEIRDTEFSESVTVEVQTRQEYRENSPFSYGSSSARSAWNNQVWESLFIVGAETNVSVTLRDSFGDSVLGYYEPASSRLVLVTDSRQPTTVSERTLAHELTHALQDQRFNLSAPRHNPPTQDAQLASNGLIEGAAIHVESRYDDRCETEWHCLPEPTQQRPAGGNAGVQNSLYHPYAQGQAYIRHTLRQDGWEGVDARFASPPTSTRQITHLDAAATNHSFASLPERQGQWTTFEEVGDNGTDSVGQASVFTMLWYQTYAYNIDTRQNETFRHADGGLSYDHPVSNGLVNDRITPYKNDTAYGYVWRLEWQTPADAALFTETYRQILEGHGGQPLSDTTTTIAAGSFEDVYQVSQNGTTVTIVNAPTTTAIDTLGATQTDTGLSIGPLLPALTVRTIVVGLLPALALAYGFFWFRSA